MGEWVGAVIMVFRPTEVVFEKRVQLGYCLSKERGWKGVWEWRRTTFSVVFFDVRDNLRIRG